MRSQSDFDDVQALIRDGLNPNDIVRLTGIPRTTIRDWQAGLGAGQRELGSGERCPVDHAFDELPASPYSYLLGMYLGDGYIAPSRKVWKLRITMDASYPAIIQECCDAMEAILPNKKAHRLRRKTRCVEVSMYWKHWPCVLSQHGPGKKHQRSISLEPWQEKLTEQAPESLVRGLIHSDGCRVVTLDRGVESVRYHFKNRSEDIKEIFCTHLDLLGIPWTRPCDMQVAVYRKIAVKRLDEFIGPKE